MGEIVGEQSYDKEETGGRGARQQPSGQSEGGQDQHESKEAADGEDKAKWTS